ncbi:MAG: aminotransferase class I/II-fold pyridoxal phosphate-dependent enzyme [Magnetococcales bacterium]|nr:aminotransferase class I/II-fold pyridoxal phosphate-dependent enzyme [Magnetococcales bacterium]
MIWAKKLTDIQPFYVMEVLRRAKELVAQGRDIVRLEVGEPNFSTPPPIIKAAHQALEKDQTNYTLAQGSLPLRKRISKWYGEQYGVDVSENRIIITSGTSGAFMLAFGIILDPGDRFAITDPGYPCYKNMIRLLGGQPVQIPVGPDSQYQLNASLLAPELKKGLRGGLITSPSNPTGTLINDTAFTQVVELIEGGGGVVVSDEIYHGITYGKSAKTALEFSDKAIVINGFSKYFAMTGWRLGWMIVPHDALGAVEMLQQNMFISASTIAQHAALAAFDCTDNFANQLKKYDINRVYLIDSLQKLGFDISVEPMGAFYIYANIANLLAKCDIENSQIFCERLLEEAGVAVTPGLDFGSFGAKEHLRFSYATDFERIKEGVIRIAKFLE